jgi:N-acetylmuramoyl-L-alanine amidase
MTGFCWCLDNGHGKATPGKRSPVWPDKTQLLEYEFNRDIVRLVVAELKDLGIEYYIVTPEVDGDVPLMTRAKRTNEHVTKLPKIFLSIHANAMGMGGPNPAQGFEIFTTKGQNNSDKIADTFYAFFKNEGPIKKLRPDKADGDNDMEENFTVIYAAHCPAVLLELGFMTNPDECKLLQNPIYRGRLAHTIVRAIAFIDAHGIDAKPLC